MHHYQNIYFYILSVNDLTEVIFYVHAHWTVWFDVHMYMQKVHIQNVYYAFDATIDTNVEINAQIYVIQKEKFLAQLFPKLFMIFLNKNV